MAPPALIAIALGFLPALYVSVFAHEVGHALIGRAAGYLITSFGVGVARPFFVLPVCGVRIFFCRSKPMNGLTFAWHPHILPSRGRMVAFLSGGILFNGGLALACLAFVAWVGWARSVWLVPLLVANSVLSLASLVPASHRIGKAVVRSDGALILQVLRSGSYGSPSAIIVQGVEFVQTLSNSIGDMLLSHFNLLGGTAAWDDLEDLERAGALFDRASARPEWGVPAVDALGQFVRSRLALAAGRLHEADAALNSAETIFRSEGNEAGSFLVFLRRQEARLARGEASSVAAELEACRSNPLLGSLPVLGMAYRTLRLSAAIAGSDLAAVERLVAEYATVRRRLPSATSDLKVYRAVARFHAQRGDLAAAEPAYRRVLDCILEISDSWVDQAEGRRFLDRHAGLAEEARQCLQSLGKGEEAEHLVASILTPESATVRRAEAVRARDRKLRGYGLQIMIVNVAVLALSVVCVSNLPLKDAAPFFLLAFSIVVFTVPGALYLAFDLTLGRKIRFLRGSGGAVVLILACCPWLALLAALVFWSGRSAGIP
jgi:hypothetical protein